MKWERYSSFYEAQAENKVEEEKNKKKALRRNHHMIIEWNEMKKKERT